MPEYNDGNVPYGVAAITASNTLYVVEQMTFDEGGSVIDRRNGSNVMSGRVVIDDNNRTGTLRLQRATTVTNFPGIGATFTPPSNSAVTFQCYILGGGHNYGQAEAHTFDVRFATRIN